MSRWLKVLVVLMAVIAVAAVAVGYYVSRYDDLTVEVDPSQSSPSYPSASTVRLHLTLVLSNSGSRELFVPPTTFDLRVDGVDAGPGESEAVTVPPGGRAFTTAVVTVDRAVAPLAFLALVDQGRDRITLDGQAHVELGPFTLDIPFEESFYMDV